MMLRAIIFLAVLSFAQALDINFNSITCQGDYVAAEVNVTCPDGSTKCALGDSIVVAGTLQYSGLTTLNLQGDTAYATANMSVLSKTYTLFQDVPVSLCYNGLTASNNNQYACPGNGSYDFSIQYTLPNPKEANTWFATGWSGNSYLDLYAGANKQDPLLGSCTFSIKTAVSGSASQKSLINTPSAGQAAAGVLVGLAALALVCSYCMCFRGRRDSKSSKAEPLVGSDFERMPDKQVESSTTGKQYSEKPTWVGQTV